MMPYIWAALRLTRLPWVDVVKAPMIICDVINVWLVGVLAGGPCGPTRRLLYAVSPVAIIVTSLHGQVEPASLSLLLGGLVLLRQRHCVAAGTLFGFAIATKTWPILVVAAILLGLPRRHAGEVALSAIVVLSLFFLSSVVLLSSPALTLVRALVSYSSFAGFWGWSGTLSSFGHASLYGYDSPAAGPGTVLVAIAVIAVLVAFRDASSLSRAWTALMALLTVTPGLGPQYLIWPLPMAIAAGEATSFYSVAATGYMLASYLPLFTAGGVRQPFVSGLSWLVIAAMCQMLWLAFQRTRRSTRELATITD